MILSLLRFMQLILTDSARINSSDLRHMYSRNVLPERFCFNDRSIIGRHPMKRWVIIFINVFTLLFYTTGLIVRITFIEFNINLIVVLGLLMSKSVLCGLVLPQAGIVLSPDNIGLIIGGVWWPILFPIVVYKTVYWARIKISTPLQSSSVWRATIFCTQDQALKFLLAIIKPLAIICVVKSF